MARKAKADAEAKTPTHPEVVKSLVAQAKNLMAEMAQPRGELGSHYKSVEKQGFNRKAFKQCLGLDMMEETQRADFLRTFDAMRGVLGWGAQKDMFDDSADAAAPAADPEPVNVAAENEKRIREGISTLN